MLVVGCHSGLFGRALAYQMNTRSNEVVSGPSVVTGTMALDGFFQLEITI